MTIGICISEALRWTVIIDGYRIPVIGADQVRVRTPFLSYGEPLFLFRLESVSDVATADCLRVKADVRVARRDVAYVHMAIGGSQRLTALGALAVAGNTCVVGGIWRCFSSDRS